jgi:hypothetical protein
MLIRLFKTFIVLALITALWQWLEIQIYGSATYDLADDIMLLLISPFIYKALGED